MKHHEQRKSVSVTWKISNIYYRRHCTYHGLWV